MSRLVAVLEVVAFIVAAVLTFLKGGHVVAPAPGSALAVGFALHGLNHHGVPS